MPTSLLAQAPEVLNMVETIPRTEGLSILDVGPGWGKYERLLREYLNEPKPTAVSCIEAWPPYVDEHDLRARYNVTMVGDVCDLDAELLNAYDVLFMVDVLEHIPKIRALDLLDRFEGWVIICTPAHLFHNGDGLPPTEEHVSAWTLADFAPRADIAYERNAGLLVRLAPL